MIKLTINNCTEKKKTGNPSIYTPTVSQLAQQERFLNFDFHI